MNIHLNSNNHDNNYNDKTFIHIMNETSNPRYMELKGDSSAMPYDSVWRISRGLRGQAPMEFVGDSCCRVRHADPESPIHLLSECGDARCGAHRLNYPEVRQRFRTFITRTIRKSKKDRCFRGAQAVACMNMSWID